MRSILLSGVVLMVIAGLGAFDSARAAALAFDSAADPAYAPYLTTGAPLDGVNGGYGWGPWEEWVPSGFTSTSPYIHLYANTTTGPSWFQSPVTSPGAVWEIRGLPDGATAFPFAVRYFDGSLGVGQTLSFDCEGVPIIAILSSDGKGAAYEVDPGNPYRVSFDNTGVALVSTDVPYTIGGGHISITPIDSDHAIISITAYGATGVTDSLEFPYVDVDGVAFEANGADQPGFVNNLSITPEPASAALIAAAGLGLPLRRGRKGGSLNTSGFPL